MSIRMLKLCASSISKPFFLLVKHSLENECFPHEWKKANTVPIHKKGDKQLIIDQYHYYLYAGKSLRN